MKVGDLVLDKYNPEARELAVIIKINPNGDCICLYASGEYLTSPQWLEVLCK
jgi:hypothetical protein